MKELHQSNSKSAIQEIREKLKAIIDCEDTDFSDFVDAVAHDYALPAVRDCLIFYTTGRITAYIKQHTQCSTCLNAFLTTSEIHADTISFSCDQLPESLSRFAKINKDFIHPNVKLYKLITVVEYLFNKHCRSSNSFDLILDDLISSETKFSFQCKEHANEAVEMLAYIIQFYLQIRMRQFVRQEMAEIKKVSVLKKKAAKLCDT